MSRRAVLVLLAACGGSKATPDASVTTPDATVVDAAPDPDAPADAAPVVGSVMFAARPAIAQAGAVITLEGTFGAAEQASFPGGVDVAATTLGAHRARVTMPATATAGPFSVVGAGPAPLTSRRTSFPLALGRFAVRDPQAAFASTTSRLVFARAQHSATVIGNSLFVIGGGSEANGVETTVERAAINADGSLGGFSVVRHITVPRGSHTAVVIGKYLYLVGGRLGDYGIHDSVDRAEIQPDGSLGPFSIVPNVKLQRARAHHSSAVIGKYLYVFGGGGENPLPQPIELDSIERAEIQPDGKLGPFAIVPGVKLVTARGSHSTVVAGDFVYIIAGGAAYGDIERAPIAADGSLGPFVKLPGTLGVPRTGHHSLVLGNQLYVLGGFPGFGLASTKSVERATIQANGDLGAFAPAGELAVGRTSFSIAVAGNFVYACAGLGDFGQSIPATCEHATIGGTSTLADFAVITPALATARSGHELHASGDSIYVIGAGPIERIKVRPDGTFEAPTTTATALVTPRAHLALARFANHLYAIGGRGASGVLASVEQSDIGPQDTLGQFVATANLAVARERHAAVVLDNMLYVVGGRDANGNALASVEAVRVNAAGDLVTSFAVDVNLALATARSGHTAAVFGRSIYVFGGSDANGVALTSIERATINADGTVTPFAVIGHLATARSGHAMAVIGDRLYAFGSATIESAPINADDTIGAFQASAVALGDARAFTGAVAVGNFVYLVGGVDGTTQLASILRAQLQ